MYLLRHSCFPVFVGVRSRNKKEAIIQKIKEWVLSIQLERRYTKEEIIAMYLNIYDFGYNADGVRSAAKREMDLQKLKRVGFGGKRILLFQKESK